MCAHGKKTGEGAASAVCTRENFRKSVNNRAKTNNIRQFNKRLGEICGLGSRNDTNGFAPTPQLRFNLGVAWSRGRHAAGLTAL